MTHNSADTNSRPNDADIDTDTDNHDPEMETDDSNQDASVELTVDAASAGMRFDQYCAANLPDYSRERIKSWILEGDIRLNGEVQKPKVKVQLNDVISGTTKAIVEVEDQAEDIPIDVVYEDDHLLIVNKPVGLVVHPAVGNRTGTLVNALLWHYPDIQQVPRAGIVHRLDKDTSGVMMVAKTIATHTALVAMLQAREIKREYQAIVGSLLPAGGTIDQPIGRHHSDRLKMAVISDGKYAITHYTIAEKFLGYSLVDVKLETGRTHQIRVHMASIHAPIVGDKTYGRPNRFDKNLSQTAREALNAFPRQALHAKTLTLQHPITGETVVATTELPEDMKNLVAVLREASL